MTEILIETDLGCEEPRENRAIDGWERGLSCPPFSTQIKSAVGIDYDKNAYS